MTSYSSYSERSHRTNGQNYLLGMKITTLLLFSVCLTASAGGIGQKVTISENNVHLEKIFKEIKRQTGFVFFYDATILQGIKPVSIHVKNETVEEVLKESLKGQPLDFSIEQKTITIIQKASYSLNRMQAKLASLVIPVSTPKAFSIITGTVKDAQGNALAGVSVLLKGTTKGTSSANDGSFSIDANVGDVLEFTTVGYQKKSVVLGQNKNIVVVMDIEVAVADEVVVIGYGTQKKSDLTGSISTVPMNDVTSVPTTNFQNAIQGRVSGVTVSTPGGGPGATPQIKIRGTGSIGAGNDPLYVINGIPIPDNANLAMPISKQTNSAFQATPASPLSAINTQNIESINILKGPSATAIYGSRGSNGVIIITTKQGAKDDKPTVNLNVYSGVQNATHLPKLMNSKELIAYTEDSRNNYYLQRYNATNPTSPNFNPGYNPKNNTGRPFGDDNTLIPDQYINWDGKTDVDWLKEVLSPAAISDYNLSVSGGGERSTYFLSGEFFDQKGTIKGSSFKRYSVNASVASDVIKDRLKIGSNLMLAYSDAHQLPANAPYFAQPPGIIYSALVSSPIVAPYNADGTLNQLNGQAHLTAGNGTAGGTTDASNPLAIMKSITDKTGHTNIIGNVYAQLKLTNDLNFETSLGGVVDNFDKVFFLNNVLLYRTATKPAPYAQQNAVKRLNWVTNNFFNYSPQIGNDHSLKILAGFTSQKNIVQSLAVYSDQQPDDKVSTVNGGIINGGTGLRSLWSLVSYLGRVNYGYKNKYLVTGTVRSDRSSRFGMNKQTGVFPSGAIAWRIDQEPFFSSVRFMNQFKLRAEYGHAGNFAIPDYGSYSMLDKANYVLGGAEVSGLAPITFGNSRLTWELSKEVDFGADLGFFNNRIEISLDYYRRITQDLLLNVTVPSALGFSSVLTNIGKVKNEGFEISVRSVNLTGNLMWNTDMNFSLNRNRVLQLGPNNSRILSAGAAGIRNVTQVGSPIGSYFGYVATGVYMTDKEIQDGPKDMQAPDPKPGDIKFKDVNGDGKITPDDRTELGSYEPKFTYGMTNNFKYKNVDMSIFVQGVYGRKILNLTTRHLENGEANFNSYAIENDRWISPSQPGNGTVPRADRNSNLHGNNNRESSFQVQDGSYFRIKNASIGYTMKGINNFIKSARFYVQGDNIALFTPYIGFNPEVSLQPSNNLVQGEDYGAYPLARTFTFGIDFRF
ncbi:MAG: TonB-dependent receptor [Ginsengibacter sp.]